MSQQHNTEEAIIVGPDQRQDGEVLVDESAMDFLDTVIAGKSAPAEQVEDDAIEINTTSDEDTVDFGAKDKVQTLAEKDGSESRPDGDDEPDEEGGKKGADADGGDGADAGDEDGKGRQEEDPIRREAMDILAKNPKMSMAEAEVIAKRILGVKDEESEGNDGGVVNYDDLPLSQKIEFDKNELNEIVDSIIEKERLDLKDEEWAQLQKKKTQLELTIAENSALFKIRGDIQDREEQTINELIENQEKELIKEFPDLADEDSALFAVVEKQSAKLAELHAQGKAPSWFNRNDPACYRKIVEEANKKLGGTSKQTVSPANNDHKAKGPVSVKGGRNPSQIRPVTGSDVEESIKIVTSGSDQDFLDSLDAAISGKANQPTVKRFKNIEIV